MATWDARAWLAGFIGCERDELVVRSIDRYGDSETQARSERAGEVVARLIVTGPHAALGRPKGSGHLLVSVRIGSGSEDVHSVEIPEADEIGY